MEAPNNKDILYCAGADLHSLVNIKAAVITKALVKSICLGVQLTRHINNYADYTSS